MSTILVTYYITPPGWILETDFDFAWAAVDPNNSTSRKEFFVETYNLVYTSVEVAPDEFEPAYLFSGSWWPAVFELFSTTDPTCYEPCALVRFPNAD